MSRFRVAPQIHSRRFAQDLVVLDLRRGEYFSLDELGAEIWEQLAAGNSVADVVAAMGPRYDVQPDRFQADILTLALELVGRGLLVPSL
jgi:hypothetical protein